MLAVWHNAFAAYAESVVDGPPNERPRLVDDPADGSDTGYLVSLAVFDQDIGVLPRVELK